MFVVLAFSIIRPLSCCQDDRLSGSQCKKRHLYLHWFSHWVEQHLTQWNILLPTMVVRSTWGCTFAARNHADHRLWHTPGFEFCPVSVEMIVSQNWLLLAERSLALWW